MPFEFSSFDPFKIFKLSAPDLEKYRKSIAELSRLNREGRKRYRSPLKAGDRGTANFSRTFEEATRSFRDLGQHAQGTGRVISTFLSEAAVHSEKLRSQQAALNKALDDRNKLVVAMEKHQKAGRTAAAQKLKDRLVLAEITAQPQRIAALFRAPGEVFP